MSPRSRRNRRHPFGRNGLWRFARHGWLKFLRIIRTAFKFPPTVRAVAILSAIVLLWLVVNWAYHTFDKPSELFFPLDHALDKSPAQTWKEYGVLFREHSTAVITPDLLAALAQAEGAGNPVARTYWRWQWSWNPFEWYQPASSAIGMFQITDGTFEEAKHYCIHDHVVVEDGPWHDLRSCWFNSFYTRVLPSHAIELTAALLDREVMRTLGAHRRVTLQKKQDLAAVMHLCGAGAGRDYVRRGFRLGPHQRCGDHDARLYLARINGLKLQFKQ